MADYSTNGHKSAAELEREVEMQRDRVSSTIDEIQNKLSPGQIVDQLMDFTKGGANEFASNLGRGMKENPLPVALLGLSLFWLMAGKNPVSGLGGHGGHSSHHDAATSPGPVGYRPGDSDAYRHQAYQDDQHAHGHGLVDGIKDAAGNVKHAASDLREKIASGASDAFDEAGNRISGLRHDLDDRLGGARERLHDARDTISHRAHDLRDQVSGIQGSAMTMLRDQPLIAGALAFAAGAALAAALPVTSKEKELFGETSAEVREAVQKAAAPYVEKGKAVLGDAMEQGKEVLDEALESGKTALKDAKDTLAEGYDDVKQTVTSSLEGKDDSSKGGTSSTDGSKIGQPSWQTT